MQRKIWTTFSLALAAAGVLGANALFAQSPPAATPAVPLKAKVARLGSEGVLEVILIDDEGKEAKEGKEEEQKVEEKKEGELKAARNRILHFRTQAAQPPAVPVPVPGLPGAQFVPGTPTQALLQRKFYLGLQLAPLPDLIKSQLKLEDGVVVTFVIHESPAAKAGIEQHDIIRQAGDKSLKQPEELIKVIEDSKGKEIELKILRAGKETTAKITPGTPPEGEFNVRVLPPGLAPPEVEHLFVRPGIVLRAPTDVYKLPQLPGNMTIKVNKEGEGPAKIVVTHDGKTYETTADKLDVLPEPIRPHLERMLGAKDGGTVDLDVLVGHDGPAVRLEVESKNIDETLDKWLPGAQALLKEANDHKQRGEMLEEALRRAMVFAQRHQADAVRATKPAPATEANADKVADKLDAVLKQLEELQNRLRAVEQGLDKK